MLHRDRLETRCHVKTKLLQSQKFPTCPCRSVLRSIKAHVRANTAPEDVKKERNWHAHLARAAVPLSRKPKISSKPWLRLTWRGEGVGVALMEAAGEMLQHALPLLGLSYQQHHFQERSEREKPKEKKKIMRRFMSVFLWEISVHEIQATPQ